MTPAVARTVPTIARRRHRAAFPDGFRHVPGHLGPRHQVSPGRLSDGRRLANQRQPFHAALDQIVQHGPRRAFVSASRDQDDWPLKAQQRLLQ